MPAPSTCCNVLNFVYVSFIGYPYTFAMNLFLVLIFAFISTGFGQSNSTEINPYYLAHGGMFIANFCLLIPISALFILLSKKTFGTLHNYLGFCITVLLIAGWVVLTGTDPTVDTEYTPLVDVDYGVDHSLYGKVACYVTAVVCATGTILMILTELPKALLTIIRLGHAVGGVLVAIYGTFVVWTGWIRLAPVTIEQLDSTPLVWMSPVIVVAGLYFIIVFIRRLCCRKAPVDPFTTIKNVPMTQADVDEMVKNGKLILIIDGTVCEIPPTFAHPGGIDLLKQFNGSDIGPVMRATKSFRLENRAKYFPHSDFAIKQMLSMRIGRIVVNPATESVVEEQIDLKLVQEKFPVYLVSNDQKNRARDFPVLLVRILIADPVQFAKIKPGMRVHLSHTGTERPYVVLSVDDVHKTFNCAIKVYKKGSLSRKLLKLVSGAELNMAWGAMYPTLPARATTVLMLAGGMGITPMYYYMNECGRLGIAGVLMWWVRDSADVFMLDELKQTADKNKVKVEIFFTRTMSQKMRAEMSDAEWNSEYVRHSKTGHINDELIKDGLSSGMMRENIATILSGPPGFVKAATESISQLGIPEDLMISLD